MEKKRAFLTMLLIAVLGSSVVVLTKIGLRELPPLQFLFWRLLVTTLVLLPIIKYRQHRLPLSLKDKIWLISLLPTINFLLYIFGINLTGATIAQTIYVFVPGLTAVIAHFLIKERLNSKKVIGLTLGLAGTLMVVALPLLNGQAVGNLHGNLLILMAAISWAAYPVVAKKMQANYTPLVLTTTMMIPATIISGLFTIYDIVKYGWIDISLGAWMIVLYTGIITVFFYLMTHRLIQRFGALMGTMVLYILPITAFLWAAPLLGEKLTLGLVIGGALAILGSYLVTLH